MTDLYIRNVPRDLYRRLRDKKELMDCRTWVTFLYEVDRILNEYLEGKK